MNSVMQTHETFTAEEQALLTPYVTNTDQSIFVLKNLPEVIKGALFSRYSRSTLGLRQLLLKDFILNKDSAFADIQGTPVGSVQDDSLAIQKAQEFYDRILDGYGDDSIGELGGAHLAIENISILATKIIQDARIGGSPLEKSTRYVTFNKKVNGEYLFYHEPKLLKSSHRQLYLDTNRFLFDTYSQLIDPVTVYVKTQIPREGGDREGAYNRSVRAKVFDLIRGVLPASALTNMGVFGNGRFFEVLLSKLQSSPSEELQTIAQTTHAELGKVIPSFIRRAEPEHRHLESYQKFIQDSNQLAQQFTNKHVTNPPEKTSELVQLIDYDPEGEKKLLAALLYPHAEQPLHQLREIVSNLSLEEKQAIILQSVALRENRRHKPGRALEMVFYTFDIQGDYGMFRDLHRHRILTQERQLLSTRFGYHCPEEIVEAGMGKTYQDAMERAAGAYETIARDFPYEAQYVVPLCYNIRWFVHINLRALMWLIELRSTPQGHENYRKVAQAMYRKVEQVHPLLAQYIKFVDLNEYSLGRLGAEIRQETKISGK
ncbi:MAG: FAD-dependent thymidylate synthase [SAR324 cluster bacterium]|nr:FAD-dependent thymidylate synthase [SAR324 cluster bacterium]